VLDVHGRDRSLEDGGEDVAAPRDALELVCGCVPGELEQALSERELPCDRSATLTRDDVRPNLREPAFGRSWEAIEDGARDRKLEDAVAQELEPLVRVGAILDPRGVGEYLLEPVGGKLRDQAAELGRPCAYVGLRPDAR
jgi:hypothetical protein